MVVHLRLQVSRSSDIIEKLNNWWTKGQTEVFYDEEWTIVILFKSRNKIYTKWNWRFDGVNLSATHVITECHRNDIDDIVGRSIAEIDNLRDVLKQRVKRHLNQK